MENAHRIIAREVGMSYVGPGEDAEITRLAGEVRMTSKVLSEPLAVAREITRFLDDIVRNP